MKYIDISKIKLSKKYRAMVPRMSKEDDQIFDDSIKNEGIKKPLELNQDLLLLDGHSRIEKAKKYSIIKIPYYITKFSDKLLEEKHVIEVNLKRRHLTTFQKVKLAIPLLKIEQQISNSRKLSKLKNSKPTPLASNEASGKSVKHVVSKIPGLSASTLERGQTIIKEATQKEKEDLEENKTNINRVYKNVIKRRKKADLEKKLRKNQTKLPKTAQLFNERFQENKIKPNTVKLIITDPPYVGTSLPLYEDLAKKAQQVLINGGSVLCYVGHYAIDTVIDYFKAQGLNYHWIIVVEHSGASASVFGRKILVGYKPILWFVKGKYQGDFVRDHIKSEFQGKELHDWAQSTVESDYYIKHMTIENEIVYDPFMGQGTFGISAIKLKRQFIGSEIDKNHFRNAKKLISST